MFLPRLGAVLLLAALKSFLDNTMMPIRSQTAALLTAMALLTACPALGAVFADVLAQPAQMSPLASRSLLQGVSRVGDRLVAVGQRGHIVVSTDGGTTWKQSPVPVSSDLTAVYFINEKKGWAVGHDGVILHSADGGASWSLQLDGRRANDLLLADIKAKAGAHPGSAEVNSLLAEAERHHEQGADKPFLDVWFADENIGFVVGAYNLIFRTGDGGKTWAPWFDRTDNAKFLNLYAIRAAAGSVYIAGEAGLVLRLDGDGQRFSAVNPDYKGSFFGVLGDANMVLVHGLRGNAFRSADGGKNWVKVEAGLPATIVGGTVLARGAIVLADVSGRVAISTDAGASWKPVPLPTSMMLAGVADAGNDRVALFGPRGIVIAPLAASRP